VIRTRHPEFTEGQGRVAHDDLGWGRVCTSPVHVVDVPGEHLGMVRPPVVERVGALIDAELRAAAMGIEPPPDPPVL
jgi:thioesterase domain-containing protein